MNVSLADSIGASTGEEDVHQNQSDTVSRVKAELRDPFCSCGWAYFDRLVSTLSEDELRSFGYNYYYINFISTFLRSRTREEIRVLASECNRLKLRAGWLHTRYTAHYAESPRALAEPYLKGWDRGRVAEALKARRGLLVCTGHIGCFRHIPFDLMLLGFRPWLAVDAESYRQKVDFAAISESRGLVSGYVPHPQLPTSRGVRVVDVESDAASVRILTSALARNEIVVLFMDGNSGYGGPLERSNRMALSFLNRKCLVKYGVAMMALLNGTPILPVFARYDGPGLGASVICEEVISSSSLQDKCDRRERATALTSDLFRLLENQVEAMPEQWEGACTFHRWRECYGQRSIGEPSPREEPRCWDGETEDLNIALIKDGSGVLAVDTDTLRIYQARPDARVLSQTDARPA